MKKLLIILTFIYLPYSGYSQNESLPDPEPYFSALIVNDIDLSISWYSDNLGFAVLNKDEFPDMGSKQANLKRGNVMIELIELTAAMSVEDVVPNYTHKTRMVGFFKIGFLVRNFEKWHNHLIEAKVDFHGRVVTDKISGKRMVIIKDPDGNRIQLFEK